MSRVSWPAPLQRLNPWYPGQFGVPGTDSETGLRMNSTGAVFYVDPNAVGVSDQRDGTDPVEPLQTVAAALLKCQPYRGDVIAVMASNSNQYANGALGNTIPIAEEVTVNCPGVRIVGVNPSSSTGVVWTPASNGGTCITVNANDVLIEGFYFTQGAYAGCNGILNQYDGTNFFGDYMTVRHCYFDDSVDDAITVDYTWYLDIYGNVFERCDQYGIRTTPAGGAINYSHIHDNTFLYCVTAAISLLLGSDLNSIHGNRIYGDGTGAVNFIDLTGGADNLVTDNWLACTLAQYVVPGTCADTTSGAWVNNHCIDGDTVSNP